MNTVVDTVVQHQVENIHVMRPTVAAWLGEYFQVATLHIWDAVFFWGNKEHKKRVALPETNISPENRPLEKEIPIGNHHF